MKKFKVNAVTKNFIRSEKGAYGAATGFLMLPLLFIVAITIDTSGALKTRSQVERLLDSAAYTITAENSKFRVKASAQNLQSCTGSYENLTYDQFKNIKTECQYHLILADIERRSGVQGLESDQTRNEAIIEATARVYLGSNRSGLYTPNKNDRITKNVNSECRKDSSQGSLGIVCVVAGSFDYNNSFGLTSQLDANNKNTIGVSGNGVATRSALIPPPLDVVVAVDISAPFIDNSNQGYYNKNAVDTLVDLYNKQKTAMGYIANFIGKLETHMFDNSKNPNNRLSYLAFSGGGQETPLQTQPTDAGVSGTLRKNVLPYILRGQGGIFTSPGDLTFNFHNDYFFESLYFPFYRGSGVNGVGFSSGAAHCVNNNSIWGCAWNTKSDAFTLISQDFSDTSLAVNDKETIFTQYLKVRFKQKNDLTFNASGVGSQSGNDCQNIYSGQSQTQNLQLQAQTIGVNCFNSEVNLDNSGYKPEYGVSGVFVGMDDFIDSKRTVAQIAHFNGQEQPWKLSRTANYPDMILPIKIYNGDKYPNKPNGNTNQQKEILDVAYPQGNALLYEYYSFTPTRNINKELESRYGWCSHPCAEYDYVNTRAVLTSQWENRESYNQQNQNNNSLKAQFLKVNPSGVSFPSSGMLLGANKMMAINPATNGKEKTQRVLVVIMSERNERQDLLMMDNLVKAGMCDKIRERFKNNGQDFDGQIFVVNVDFLRFLNQGGTISRPANQNYKQAYLDKRNESITQCVKDSYYLTKAYYNTLDYELDRLASKIMDKNASLGGTNRAISVRNLPMYK